ncbi:hypothetical protein LWI29_021662 [Acer saccharum]|uniref:DUF4216 domain-containing protein n=1 Tax=Acer saccharum TaxID=4024 RepID=A0AA39VWD7_ACESA|nr:hypothetical protein LWI29_021662 [Acer saccharum]
MVCDGLDIGYFSNIWIYHDELDSTQAGLNNKQPVQVDDMHGMLRNALGVLDDGGNEFDGVVTFVVVEMTTMVEVMRISMVIYHHGDVHVNEDLKLLAQGPNKIALRFKKYLINGFRFQIKEIDIRSKTQNSGVVVTVKTSNLASSKDKNLIVGDVSYFGNVVDVIELDYYGGRKVVLFKCDWIDINSNQGTKKDELGFTLVNPSYLQKTEEPFILASQAIQVFYVEDPMEIDLHVVVFTKPRDLYDMDEVANVGDLLMEDNTANLQQFMDNEDDVRDNVPEIMINSPVNIIDVGAKNNDSDDDDEDEYDN